MKLSELQKKFDERPFKSLATAWDKGVNEYAEWLLEHVIDGCGDLDVNGKTLRETLLCGATSWHAFSWGGCALVYNGDIVEALCGKDALEKYDYGNIPPRKNREWLDMQTKALVQAERLIKDVLMDAKNGK